MTHLRFESFSFIFHLFFSLPPSFLSFFIVLIFIFNTFDDDSEHNEGG